MIYWFLHISWWLLSKMAKKRLEGLAAPSQNSYSVSLNEKISTKSLSSFLTQKSVEVSTFCSTSKIGTEFTAVALNQWKWVSSRSGSPTFQDMSEEMSNWTVQHFQAELICKQQCQNRKHKYRQQKTSEGNLNKNRLVFGVCVTFIEKKNI